MNRTELNFVLKILNRIKDPDEQVKKAKAYIDKDLATFDARRGQLRETYETNPDIGPW